MRYKIALHKSDEGYSVSVPGLPGCWSQGATEDEAIATSRQPYASIWKSLAILTITRKSSSCNELVLPGGVRFGMV